ncbi:MAG: hypothetical protein M0P57_07685 [Syntrophales bacterium]|jgi:hypothetical protein|nr:hypothetical protein [Syntrophales bacterium]
MKRFNNTSQGNGIEVAFHFDGKQRPHLDANASILGFRGGKFDKPMLSLRFTEFSAPRVETCGIDLMHPNQGNLLIPFAACHSTMADQWAVRSYCVMCHPPAMKIGSWLEGIIGIASKGKMTWWCGY